MTNVVYIALHLTVLKVAFYDTPALIVLRIKYVTA